MFKIGDFISEIGSSGVLRTNRYLATFSAPEYLRLEGRRTSAAQLDANGTGAGVLERLALRCESVQMPGMSFATIDGPPRPGYGPIEAVPYNTIFDDVTLTFVVDARSDVHRFFYKWMNSVVNFNSKGQSKLRDADGPVVGMKTFEVGYKDKYVTDITIEVYDSSTGSDAGAKVMTAKMYRAFPKVLPSFDLSWGSSDDVVRLSIPFTYTDFDVEYHNQPKK